MFDESLGLTGSGVTNSSDGRVVTRADRTTMPISTVFGRFKDMPVSSDEANFTTHTYADLRGCTRRGSYVPINNRSCSFGMSPAVSSGGLFSVVNHAYLCLDVGTQNIRHQIINFCPSNTNIPTNGAISLNSSIAVNIEVVEAYLSSRVEFSPAYMGLEDGNHSRFLQMYIYDTYNEVNNRMRHFGGLDAPGLNPEILEGLIHVLDEHNGLVRLFRTARDRCNAGEISGFKIRLYNLGVVRGYKLPTSDVLGAIVFEDGPRSRTDFDVIIEFRGGPPKRISKLHQSYMSLQFPLLFVFGQPRFYPELILKPRNGIVTVFCAIEQSRLDFIRKRHKDLRSDYLSVTHIVWWNCSVCFIKCAQNGDLVSLKEGWSGVRWEDFKRDIFWVERVEERVFFLDRRAIPHAMAWRHHDSDIHDPLPTDGFSASDVATLTSQSIDIRPVLFGLLFHAGLATTWEFSGFLPVFKDTKRNVVTMSDYLRFPFLDGATVGQGDALSARNPITQRTIGPLPVNQSPPEKTARMKEVETFDPKIVAIRERKARAAAKKRAERKRVADGEGSSKGKTKRRKVFVVRAEEEDSTKEASSASPLRAMAPNPSFLLKDVDDAETTKSQEDEHVSIPRHDSANTSIHNYAKDHDESFNESEGHNLTMTETVETYHANETRLTETPVPAPNPEKTVVQDIVPMVCSNLARDRADGAESSRLC
ncbi:hypothetical protein Tco_0296270 [Tanacetum coccineum]